VEDTAAAYYIYIYICTYLLLNPSLLAFEVDVVVGSFCSFAPRVGRCAPLIKSLGNEWICFVLITVVFSFVRIILNSSMS